MSIKNQKHHFIMNPRTLYKKTCSCRNEQTQHVYIQTLYIWALPVKLNSTDCTHGHCPYIFTLKPGCFSPPIGTAPGNVAPGMGRMQSVPGYEPLWQPSRWKSCRDAGSAQAASPVPDSSPQEAVSSLSFGQFICTSWLPWGKTSLPSSVSNCMTSGFLAHLPLNPLNGPGSHSLFLWLKGRNCRERTFSTSFSIPLKWR